MEFKGTKGKWKINSANKQEVNSINGIAISDCGWSIMITNEEKLANTLLISKAPEMLEMLNKCKSTISRLKNSMRAHTDYIEHSEFADYVELAEQQEYEIELLIKEATQI